MKVTQPRYVRALPFFLAFAASLLFLAFAGCGGRIAQLAPEDAGSSDPIIGSVLPAPADAGTRHPIRDAGSDVSDFQDGDLPDDAGDGAIPWDGDPYYDAASYPPCIDYQLYDADIGAPSSQYPAFTPDVPRIVDVGGPVMVNPTIVPITYVDDPQEPSIESFIASFGQSSYWAALQNEYGVAPPVSSVPVRLDEWRNSRPFDGQIESWLLDKLDGTHPEFPPPTPNTVYVIYYPPGVKVALPGSLHPGCQPYHWQTRVPGYPTVAYVVIPACQDSIDDLTAVSSQLVLGAITDPMPLVAPAYAAVDADHFLWTVLYGTLLDTNYDFATELADPCSASALGGSSTVLLPDLNAFVQRRWSNVAARAGHDPCVPAQGPSVSPYFNVTPVLRDSVDGELPPIGSCPPGPDPCPRALIFHTKGTHIPVGSCRVLELDVFSDGPTAPIMLSAVESPDFRGKNQTLQFSFDRAQAVNGEKVHLTVAVQHDSTAGFSGFYITGSQNGQTSQWPVMIDYQSP